MNDEIHDDGDHGDLERYLSDGKIIDLSEDEPRPHEPEDRPEEEDHDDLAVSPHQDTGLHPVHMRVVGAWAVWRIVRKDPEYWVSFARSLRLNRIDLMINSKHDRGFEGPSAEEIADFAERCRRHGIEPHVTSWIAPRRAYIEAAAKTLLPLLQGGSIASLVWDAEGPWLDGEGDLSHRGAGRLIGELFAGQRLGVTSIVDTDGAKCEPLVEHALDLLPQPYWRSGVSRHSPDRKVRDARRAWERRFQRAPNIMSLAGWQQGAEPAVPMRAAVSAVATCGVDTVCYWDLHWIKLDPGIARFVAALRA